MPERGRVLLGLYGLQTLRVLDSVTHAEALTLQCHAYLQ
jgi:hypothetical protein